MSTTGENTTNLLLNRSKTKVKEKVIPPHENIDSPPPSPHLRKRVKKQRKNEVESPPLLVEPPEVNLDIPVNLKKRKKKKKVVIDDSSDSESDSEEDDEIDPILREKLEKQDILNKLKYEEAMGATLPKRFTMKSDLSEMRASYDSIKYMKKAKSTVRLFRRFFIIVIKIVEKAVTSIKPLQKWVDLDGWSTKVAMNIEDYDEIFHDIYDYHDGDIPGLGNPYFRLAYTIGMSAVVYSIGKRAKKSRLAKKMAEKMAEKGMSDVDSIMANRPDLAKEIYDKMHENTLRNNVPPPTTQRRQPTRRAPAAPQRSTPKNPISVGPVKTALPVSLTFAQPFIAKKKAVDNGEPRITELPADDVKIGRFLEGTVVVKEKTDGKLERKETIKALDKFIEREHEKEKGKEKEKQPTKRVSTRGRGTRGRGRGRGSGRGRGTTVVRKKEISVKSQNK